MGVSGEDAAKRLLYFVYRIQRLCKDGASVLQEL